MEPAAAFMQSNEILIALFVQRFKNIMVILICDVTGSGSFLTATCTQYNVHVNNCNHHPLPHIKCNHS
ncbi:hypothetical protein RR46_12764 [Papilio xuthus]|uniref:Uncharacterized protein n=1 Tax=Papilio xuthus TaxID=66420 RepID=A0A194PVE5_PAPXU|nr:hypothetical protein RR46_12764 [Papilio xuthus]